jgi:hypothetical protein
MSIIHPSRANLRAAAAQARRLADALEMAADGGPPRAALAEAPILSYWEPVRRFAPALMGVVDGHPTIGPHRATVTSELFAMDGDALWARTWSRWYRLGAPMPAATGRRQ